MRVASPRWPRALPDLEPVAGAEPASATTSLVAVSTVLVRMGVTVARVPNRVDGASAAEHHGRVHGQRHGIAARRWLSQPGADLQRPALRLRANHYGQLGNATNNGTDTPNPTPAVVSLPGASGPVTQIAGGGYHSLTLTSSGQLYAFGENNYGQLGSATNSGTENPTPIPTPVDLPVGTTIDSMGPGSSADHTLAVVADLAVTSGSLPGGRVGAPYRATGSAEGGTAPYTWQASGLPAGLSLDAASGEIGGRPKKAGRARVQLVVSDRFGVSAQSPRLTLRIAPRLAISKLRQSHRRWRRGHKLAKVSSTASGPPAARRAKRAPLGTTFRFRLNEKAKVRFAFAIRRGKRFKKAGALTFAGHRGGNRVVFQGRISRRKKLRPGRYKLTVTARHGSLRSEPRTLRFTIVR